MRRREFIMLVGGAAVAWPQSPYAQQLVKLPRVGVLTAAESDATAVFAAFRMGLRDLGYVDGRTIILDFRFAKGNMNALAGLADELARLIHEANAAGIHINFNMNTQAGACDVFDAYKMVKVDLRGSAN